MSMKGQNNVIEFLLMTLGIVGLILIVVSTAAESIEAIISSPSLIIGIFLIFLAIALSKAFK